MEWRPTHKLSHRAFFALIRLALAGDAQAAFPVGEGKGNGLPHHLSGLVRNDNISSGLIIDESGSPKGDPDFLGLAAVAALVVVLILILVLVLVLIAVLILLILISVLMIHFGFLPSIHCGKSRFSSVPRISGFILRPEQKTGCQTRGDGGGNTTSGGFQSAGKNAQKPLFVHRFPDAFGKGVSKAGKGHGGSCSGKIHEFWV